MRFLLIFGSGPQERENMYKYYHFIHFRWLKISAILSHDQLCREEVIKSPCEKIVLRTFVGSFNANHMLSSEL